MPLISKTKSQLPMVLIHGSFANSKSWKKIVGNLSFEHKCITPNLPGHGGMARSDDFDAPTMKPEFDVIRSACNGAIDENQGIHLVGHSYGAVVALSLAMSGLIPVHKLTLFESVDVSVLSIFDKNEELKTVTSFEQEYRDAFQTEGNAIYARVIDYWGAPGSFDAIPEHIKLQMMTMTTDNLRHWSLIKNNGRPAEEYQKLNISTSVVVGSKSNSVAKCISKTLHENLPNCHYHEISNASHFMITSHPKECTEILKND